MFGRNGNWANQPLNKNERRRAPIRRRLHFEQLEPRCMLSAATPLPTDSFLGTAEANPVIALDAFDADPQYTGVDGTGYTVAIIDSGFLLDHPYFGPDTNEDGVSDRIVAAVDFVLQDGVDDARPRINASFSHGTHVASIAAGYFESDPINYPGLPAYTGVAPGANLALLKIEHDFVGPNLNSNWLTADYHNAFEAAFQWVINNKDTYNIVAVNFSYGSGNYDSFNPTLDLVYQKLHNELVELAEEGVIPVSITQNLFGTFNSVPGSAYPGADSHTIAVGATFDANVGSFLEDTGDEWSGGAETYSSDVDRVATFSQRHATIMDILAPGSVITGAGRDYDAIDLNGTSQAAPMVAGMAVLAQQLYFESTGELFKLDDDPLTGERGFRSLLHDSGDDIFDGDDEDDSVTNTNLWYKRANMLKLADLIVTPKVGKITISGSNSTHADFEIPVGSGEQLERIPIGGANQISIEFSEGVSVDQTDLTLYGAHSETNYGSGTSFAFDSQTNVATWTFNVFPPEQMELTLDASSILDGAGNELDGEWINADSVFNGTTNDASETISVFPSGDGQPGGDFVFRFTVLSGDFNNDNLVDGNDFLVWQGGFGIQTGATLTDGDGDGDGDVDGDDFLLWQSQFNFDFQFWPTGSQQSMMGGGSALSSGSNSNHAALDAYFASFGLFNNDDATSVERFFSTISEELAAELALGILSLQNAA